MRKNNLRDAIDRFLRFRERSLDDFCHRVFLPKLAEHITGSVLNVGCGEHVFGDCRLDIRQTSATNVLADVRQLPFGNDSFDTVVSLGVLHHVKDLDSAIGEMARVCRNKIVGWEPNIWNPALCTLLWPLGLSHERHLNPRRLVKLFHERGGRLVYSDRVYAFKLLGSAIGCYDLLLKLDPLVPPLFRSSFQYVIELDKPGKDDLIP